MHKFSAGATVYFEGSVLTGGARGVYKIVRCMPVERDNRVLYRIKSATETFERTVEESSLSNQQ